MLLSLDLIFLSVWFIVDPLAAKEITFEDKVGITTHKASITPHTRV